MKANRMAADWCGLLAAWAGVGPVATVTFNAADRGLSKRVDLRVNLLGEPEPDTDGDGVPNWAEVVAGTNPADPTSVFKA